MSPRLFPEPVGRKSKRLLGGYHAVYIAVQRLMSARIVEDLPWNTKVSIDMLLEIRADGPGLIRSSKTMG
jgi:hypothetical protein